MSRLAVFFLLVISQLLALLLALLGFETLRTNLLGWFLMLVGIGYIAGVAIVYFIRRQRFWESNLAGAGVQEEHGDRSFWLISFGMIAAFYLSPLEYLYFPLFPAVLLRYAWMSWISLALVIFGTALLVWAWRFLRESYSGHLSIKTNQALVQRGPYRFIRHPAHTGYFLMAIGISLGYSSLAGLISVFVLLLPSLVFRINIEENLLAFHFGEAFPGTSERQNGWSRGSGRKFPWYRSACGGSPVHQNRPGEDKVT